MKFGRISAEDETAKKYLPSEWLEEVTKTFNDAYEEQTKKQNRFFEVFGEIYEKEFIVIISYLHRIDPMTSPITLFVSHENLEDSKAFKAALSALVDFSGIIFDDITANDEFSEYNSLWTMNTYKDFDFHYKITRENISLTMQAEALLNEELKLD